jgi:hypothetical protein
MAGLFANVEAIAMFFNTLNEGLADRLRWDGVALPCTAPANAETRPRDCLRDNFWGWGPLVGIGGWGTVRPHAFNIFGSAVFRVALRIGTKLVATTAPQQKCRAGWHHC